MRPVPFLLAAVLLAGASPAAHAAGAIWKCVDALGTVSYSNRACGELESTERVIARDGIADARRAAAARPAERSRTPRATPYARPSPPSPVPLGAAR